MQYEMKKVPTAVTGGDVVVLANGDRLLLAQVGFAEYKFIHLQNGNRDADSNPPVMDQDDHAMSVPALIKYLQKEHSQRLVGIIPAYSVWDAIVAAGSKIVPVPALVELQSKGGNDDDE